MRPMSLDSVWLNLRLKYSLSSLIPVARTSVCPQYLSLRSSLVRLLDLHARSDTVSSFIHWSFLLVCVLGTRCEGSPCTKDWMKVIFYHPVDWMTKKQRLHQNNKPFCQNLSLSWTYRKIMFSQSPGRRHELQNWLSQWRFKSQMWK